MTQLDTLAKLATQAARVQDDLDAAIAAERKAKAELLQKIIDIALPALPSIAQKIKIGQKVWWVGNTHTDSEDTWHPVKGICLSSDNPSPYSRKDASGNSGSFTGRDLFLLVNGMLVEVQYDGYWSSWQGSSDKMTSTVCHILPSGAVTNWTCADPEAVSERLAKAFAAVVAGKATKTAEKAMKRAAKLQALAELSQ
jgi:hypothetical protein